METVGLEILATLARWPAFILASFCEEERNKSKIDA